MIRRAFTSGSVKSQATDIVTNRLVRMSSTKILDRACYPAVSDSLNGSAQQAGDELAVLGELQELPEVEESLLRQGLRGALLGGGHGRRRGLRLPLLVVLLLPLLVVLRG